jgi:predicted RND superfamily exporter protein
LKLKIKRLTETSLVARALAWVARAICRHPAWFFYPQIGLFVVAILITAEYPRIKLDTSRDNLVGSDKKYHQNFLKFKKEFPTQDDLVVVVESESPEKNRQFVERLGARLEAETNVFHDVFYKGDLKMLGTKALLFVPQTNLVDLKTTLVGYRPFLNQFTRTTNLVSLFTMINSQLAHAKREKNAENDALLKTLPALKRIVSQATASMHRPGVPPSPGITALFDPGEDAEQQIYITFDKGRIYLVTAQAPSEDKNEDAVRRIRELVEQTKAEVTGLNVGLTGEPVLELDEMAQSVKDTTVASIASLLICALIFIYGYQQTGRPVKATLCLVVGLAYTLAFATLTVGHLNLLTITFVPILIGLAIDYGVHLISRYEEELRHGKSQEDALIKAMVYTGQGIFTGAFTTAGAFLAMAFTNFKGIQEMGIICGGGLIICLIPMMTMLPVLLLRGRQNVIDHQQGDIAERRARIENFWLQRPFWVTGITVALCAVAAIQMRKVQFDYNLLNLQSAGLPAVETEQRLIESASKSVLYAAVIATNLEQAVALEQQLTNLPAVSSVDSMTKFLAEDQSCKLDLVGEIKRELASVHFAPPDLRPVAIPELSGTLWRTRGYLGLAYQEVVTEDRPVLNAPRFGHWLNHPLDAFSMVTNLDAFIGWMDLTNQLASLRDAIQDLRKEMLREDLSTPETNAYQLAAFQQALFDDVHETFQALQNQDNREPLRVRDLPQALRDRFIGTNGYYLLMVYPKKDIWKRENQEEFIKQLQPIDPNVTGTPVQLYYYTELLKDSYEEAARYSLIAIVLLVLIHFRSPLCVALALVPVGVGFLWLGGLMGFFGVALNPANIMTLPLVIGIGVTNGIHILNRFAEEQTPSILARSTGKAVLVSGLTAIAGFGSLVLGKHRGIQSLGYVMSVGLATCMIAGLTFLPALLTLFLPAKSVDAGKTPIGPERED